MKILKGKLPIPDNLQVWPEEFRVKNLTTTKRKTINTNTLVANVNNLAANLYAPGRAWGAGGYPKGTFSEFRVYTKAFSFSDVVNDFVDSKRRLPWL